MPTPINGDSQHATLNTQSSGSSLTDALLGTQRWSSGSGTLSLTYSFPWKDARMAHWDSNYSGLREPDAGYGLSSLEQNAVR